MDHPRGRDAAAAAAAQRSAAAAPQQDKIIGKQIFLMRITDYVVDVFFFFNERKKILPFAV